MNKSAKIILIAIMLFTVIFAITACVTPNTEIFVSGDPQIVLEKGSDLDLSSIKLTVTKGSELSEIALNAEGVTVSGYDKNTVGEQTLTITYDGASTTLKVKVVEHDERMVAMGHVSDYVVGDEFDDAGVLKITKDNGETVNVRINDGSIQLSGFDSDTAGVKTINVTYTNGSLVLNGSFNVNVWNADNVRLNIPTQRYYESHETEIDVTGGYLIVTANSGAITRRVTIKDEWIKGFNPDVVTEEEPTKTQEITIDYFGQTVKYTIQIKLTDITRIQRVAKALANLDWTGETPCDVTDEQGQAAMRALALYNALDEYDTYFIAKEDMLNIIRPAAIYGTQKWTDSAAEFTDLFNAKSHSLTINCDELETTKTQFAAISALEDTDTLFTYGEILVKAGNSFGEETVYGQVAFKEYVKDVCDKATVQTAISKIDLMLKMHQALEAVPANWQVADLQSSETSAKIEEAAAYAIELKELADSITERYLFNAVSQWRPEKKNDYFEILYRYYFEMYLSDDVEAQKAGVQGIDNLIDVCMPGILETYYLQYISTLIEQYDLQYVAQDGVLVQPANSVDTTSFIVAYRSLLKIKQGIYDTDDEMYITLFEEYTLNNIISQIQTADIGAFSIFGSALDEPAFDNIWTKYIDAIIAIGSSTSDDNAGQIIEDLFAEFVALTPQMQAQFLASLNPYGWADFDIDDGTGRSTMFADLIVRYYISILPQSFFDEESSIVLELFDAFQYYLYRDESLGEDYPTFTSLFVQSMTNVTTMYGALTGDDKTAFDNHIGFFYEKLSYIFNLYNEEGNFVENEIADEWATKIAELEDAYGSLLILLQVVAADYTKYPVFISAYENAAYLYNDIITNAPQNVVDKVLYTNTVMLFADIEDMSTEINTSYETLLYRLRWIYISMLVEYPVDAQYVFTAWEEYTSSESLREYFASLLNFYAAATVDVDQVTDEMVKAVLSDFLKLTDNEKALFVAMDGYGQFVYYKGLGSFFATKFADSSSTLDLIEEIINVEIGSAFLTNQEFIDTWTEVRTAYEELSEEDKAMFDEFLKEKYDYFDNIYAELIDETTTPSAPSDEDNQG